MKSIDLVKKMKDMGSQLNTKNLFIVANNLDSTGVNDVT